MRKYQKGFTLIELLVVIAIIGILSSVVLASLNSAREKGANAAAKSGMDGLRAEAVLYLDDHNNSYDGMFSDPKIASMIANITSNADGVTTSASGTTYAVSADLRGDSGNWCIDSSGAATSSAINSATGLCY